MDVTFLGQASFVIKGKNAVVVTDPFDPKLFPGGMPKTPAADIVTVSHDHPDHNFVADILKANPNAFIVTGPGEYEVKEVNIIGIPSFHDDAKGEERGKNTIFRFSVDGVGFAHLGDLGCKLTDAQVEALSGVDVLMVPVGGFYTIDAKTAAEIVAQISPSIIIPMHYKTAKHTDKIFEPLVGVEIFLKEMGREGLAPVPKFSITKDKIPEEPQLVLLS